MIEKEKEIIKPKINMTYWKMDGNAYALMGKVASALKSENNTKEIIDQFYTEAQNGDYNNLIRTCMKYADISDEY